MHSRREFFRHVAGAAVALHGCGDNNEPEPRPEPPPIGVAPDAAPPSPNASCPEHGAGTVIETNHGHVMMVSAEEVQAGASKTYFLVDSDHMHVVTVFAEQMQMLGRNETFTLESSVEKSPMFGTHGHSVRLVCA